MKFLFSLLLCFGAATTIWAVDDYKPGPDSQRQEGVPHGKLTSFEWTNSTVFPGTSRRGWIYVPAQYEAAKPAAVMVFQDGGGYADEKGQRGVPVVFDNLIARGEMPVTIGIFLNPGNFEGADNRSFEYDSMGGQYAKFVCEEILPHFAKEYNLTTDPEMRALCGGSSGGIAAFTVAWERPDVFHKVLSSIGSFTNIRGGDTYPGLIRKTERKPIRVFLQDGTNDLNNLHGNWPLSSQQMESALKFMGYDVKLELGDGGHNGKQMTAIMPDALRWLWRPPVETRMPFTKDNLGGDEALSKVLPEPGGWELVGEGYGATDAACGDAEGNVYFSDTPNATIWRVPVAGAPEKWLNQGLKVSGLKFGPDGGIYAAAQAQGTTKARIVAIDPITKVVTDIATDVQPNDLAVSKAGWIYFTDTVAGQVQMIPMTSKNSERPQAVANGISAPNGISFSANQKFLAISENRGASVWYYPIHKDGKLGVGERYMTMRVPVGAASSGGDGMVVDAEGHFYVTSAAGIQMFDQTGRMGGVIAPPNNKGCVSIAFGGAGKVWLYVCNSTQVWRRKMLTHGL